MEPTNGHQLQNCDPGSWRCLDDSMCIPESFVLDGIQNCTDGSDENQQMYMLRTCPSGWFQCIATQMCIGNSSVCDGEVDCNDGSDESIQHCGCVEDEWLCEDKSGCQPKSSVCDGVQDCPDGSDERECELFTCPAGRSKCADNFMCIKNDQICDNKHDCKDRSDERCGAPCLRASHNYNAIVKNCPNNDQVCIPMERFCDTVADCPDGADECTCNGFSMTTCQIANRKLCVYDEWLSRTGRKPSPCFNEGRAATKG